MALGCEDRKAVAIETKTRLRSASLAAVLSSQPRISVHWQATIALLGCELRTGGSSRSSYAIATVFNQRYFFI